MGLRSIISAAGVILVLASPAAAFDLTPDRIGVTGLSYHSDRDGYISVDGKRENWTEFNPGISVSYDLGEVSSITFAAFRNSFDGLGTAVLYDQTWVRGDNWSAGPFIGIAHYPDYGRFQATSLSSLGEPFEDVFATVGLRGQIGPVEIRHTPAPENGSAFTSVSLVFEIGEQRQTGSIGQSLFGSSY